MKSKKLLRLKAKRGCQTSINRRKRTRYQYKRLKLPRREGIAKKDKDLRKKFNKEFQMFNLVLVMAKQQGKLFLMHTR